METGHIGSRFVLLVKHLLLCIFLKIQRGLFQRSFVDSSLQILGSLLWVDQCNALLTTYFHEFQIPNFEFSRMFNQVGN